MTDTQKPKPRKALKRMSDKRLAQLGAEHFPGMEREQIAAPTEAAWQAEAARLEGGISA